MALTQLRCPVCKKEVGTDDPNMPFCSDRCRAIDLGNWATEKYVISKPSDRDDFEDVFDSPEDFEPGQGPVQ